MSQRTSTVAVDASGRAVALDVEAPAVSPRDRAIVRGNGAFEVMSGTGRRLIAVTEHLARLDRSAQRLLLPPAPEAVWRLALRDLRHHRGAPRHAAGGPHQLIFPNLDALPPS